MTSFQKSLWLKNERNTTNRQELFCQRMTGWLFSCFT
nr:MAG TPA: hypothetical protein [Caudoviricetes sp.]